MGLGPRISLELRLHPWSLGLRLRSDLTWANASPPLSGPEIIQVLQLPEPQPLEPAPAAILTKKAQKDTFSFCFFNIFAMVFWNYWGLEGRE